MLKKESEILYIFANKPWQSFTISELKQIYGTKSKSYIELFVKKYVTLGVLTTQKIGNTSTYMLDHESVKARVFGGTTLEHAAWNKKHIPYKDIQSIINKMPYLHHIFLVTGSFAKGIQKSNSDIDIVVLIENSCEPKKVMAELKLQAELNIPQIHLYVFKNSEFIQMLKERDSNFGKEIVKNCLVLTQGQTYLSLLSEAMNCGFTGKNLS